MSQIKKCLFPAAGYGTRFLPATKAIPKEMLPILAKPLLQYGVEEAREAGCDTMAIVTGRGNNQALFKQSFTMYTLAIILQDTMLADIINPGNRRSLPMTFSAE